MKRLVSIIIPTLNRAHLISQTLDSVIAQDYKDWECIIVDDGSTDDTENVITKYMTIDERILYFKRPSQYKRGASSCRNYGFEKSSGEFIQYLDSDDLISSNKLEQQISDIKKENLKIATCSWSLFGSSPSKDGSLIISSYQKTHSPCSFLKSMGLQNVFFPLHCYLTPKEIIEKAGKWNEDLTNNDDAEFFSRVILASSGVKFISTCTAYYRKSGAGHLSNYSNPKRVISAIKSWALIEDHLKETCKEDALTYVHNARFWLFQTVKNKFPYTTCKQRVFFKDQFEKEPKRLKLHFLLLKVLRNNLGEFKRRINHQSIE